VVDFVVGTADELRRLASLADAAPDHSLASAEAPEQQRRVEAVQARFPGVPLASLAGRIWCDAPTAAPVRARSWHTIRNLDHGGILAEMYLYGDIGEWGITAADFVQQLNSITATAITLHLNSPGGEVFEGQAIRNKLMDHPAHIEVRIDALAASIATIIAMAGDRIVVNRQGRMMIHDASGLVVGNAADMRALADVLDAVSNDMAGVYATRAGGTPKEWRARMKAETWFSAEEAVAVGLADEAIIDLPAVTEPYAARNRTMVGAQAAPVSVGPDPAPPTPSGAGVPEPDPWTSLAAAFAAVYAPIKEAV
jgi:ATP-dependent protease ClpP protease subunit